MEVEKTEAVCGEDFSRRPKKRRKKLSGGRKIKISFFFAFCLCLR